METMVKYSKKIEEQAPLLPDERGVKKQPRSWESIITRLQSGGSRDAEKYKEERIASDKTPLSKRELAMQQEIQELKKARFNCGNPIVLPQLNVKSPHRKLTEINFWEIAVVIE